MLNALVTPLGASCRSNGRSGAVRSHGQLSRVSERLRPAVRPTKSAQPYDVAAAIGTDERRMHVRAYNHWVSLLDGRDFPSIEDLEPDDVEDFSPPQRAARFHLRPRQPGHPLRRRRDPRRMRARRRHADHRRRAQPLAAVAPDRPLHADHRQPRAGRLRGRVRQSSAATRSAIAAS